VRVLSRSIVWLLLAVPVTAQQDQPSDPFAFLGPDVTLTDRDRLRLEAGEAVVRLLPRASREVAILAAVRVDVEGDRLLEWVREIEALKESEHVRAIGRFSNPPRLDDLAALSLEGRDLDAIRDCRPGSCGLKLSGEEMTRLAREAGEATGDWRQAVQDAYRRLVLARVEAYRASGYRGIAPYEDHRDPVAPGDEFSALLDRFGFLTRGLPRLATHLRQYPADPEGVESFLYWSKETLGGRPMVIVSHVFLVKPGLPGLPEAMSLSRHVYANHYITGAIAMTAVTGRRGGTGGYLVYLNRSRVDVLGGVFGPITRLFIERRLRGEAAEVVEGLRARLQSIPPGT
jgi:hypothetical protein